MFLFFFLSFSTVTFAPFFSPVQGVESIEKEIFRLTNIVREDARLPPLQYDERLCLAARQHSYEMGKLHYFAHESPVERNKTFYQRIYRSGCTEIGCGENIFVEYGFAKEGIAKRVMEGWMSSSGHRANILQKDFTHTGIGVVTVGDALYFTQEFVAREVDTYSLSIEDALGKYFFKMLAYTSKSNKIVLVINNKLYNTFNVNQNGAVQIDVPFNKQDGVKKIQWGYIKGDEYWLTNEVIIDTDKPPESIFVNSR